MKPWHFRVGYVVGTAIILALEIMAIANNVSDDTITENVRDVIFVHPIVWLVTLGANAGFIVWFCRHMWWRKQ